MRLVVVHLGRVVGPDDGHVVALLLLVLHHLADQHGGGVRLVARGGAARVVALEQAPRLVGDVRSVYAEEGPSRVQQQRVDRRMAAQHLAVDQPPAKADDTAGGDRRGRGGEQRREGDGGRRVSVYVGLGVELKRRGVTWVSCIWLLALGVE